MIKTGETLGIRNTAGVTQENKTADGKSYTAEKTLVLAHERHY